MRFVLYTTALNQDGYDVMEVSSIIKTSRAKNIKNEVSGVLLFDGMNFTQYFEGEADVVDTLLANILRDIRHKNIEVILNGSQADRLYKSWGMGYIDTSHQEIDIEKCIASADFSAMSFKQSISRLHVD